MSGAGQVSREALVQFVRAAGLGVVATLDSLRGPEAALVGLAVTDDAELIFDSPADARKIANIAADQRVAVVIGLTGDVTIQVEGTADVLAGAERERYGRIYEAQLPRSRALVEEFAVVRVRPHWLRYYDAGPHPPRVIEGDWCW